MQSNLNVKPNRLINEKSPYLQEHAHNPVDWYPWGKEALDKAKTEDKPVFVSIGYSSCHWCHVMEHESFNDQQVADLLNEAFVCIKVDREERPDIDAAYMAYCQAMGRNCGWPLNVILTPNLNPFFVASYIPKNSRFGTVGLLDLVPQIKQIWKNQRQEMEMVGQDVKRRLAVIENRVSETQLDETVLASAFERLQLDFDDVNAGFYAAPKFPMPHRLLFLMRYYAETGEKNALAMVEKTLTNMRLGGIFDQIGYGFHRYSTDAHWLVPHFEKMLYDQALLVLAYSEAYQLTGNQVYADTVRETLDYVQRELTSPEGGFYSAQDADSEGQEGKFYIWALNAIQEILSPEDAELAVEVYGLTAEGNFSEHGKSTRKNVLYFAQLPEELAAIKCLTADELNSRLKNIRKTLFEARKKRVAPALDDKVLVDWNGLMIAAYAKAGRILKEPRYVEAAKKAAEFILIHMLQGDLLFHRYIKGETAIEGFLDDYAFLSFGLIELYEATFEAKYLGAAADLAKTMIARFWDSSKGGFYQTVEVVGVPKLKQLYDGAIPSGNSVAFWVLLWLSRLTDQPNYDEMAEQMTWTFADEIADGPQAFTFFLSAMYMLTGQSGSIVLVGEPNDAGTVKMLEALQQRYLPNTAVQLRTLDGSYKQLEGKATAYVCHRQTCLPPTNNIELMLELLKEKN
ncbi:MAG: thioredoxin domain-containing protein [Candidatus Bathyarchaeia archaeon]